MDTPLLTAAGFLTTVWFLNRKKNFQSKILSNEIKPYIVSIAGSNLPYIDKETNMAMVKKIVARIDVLDVRLTELEKSTSENTKQLSDRLSQINIAKEELQMKIAEFQSASNRTREDIDASNRLIAEIQRLYIQLDSKYRAETQRAIDAANTNEYFFYNTPNRSNFDQVHYWSLTKFHDRWRFPLLGGGRFYLIGIPIHNSRARFFGLGSNMPNHLIKTTSTTRWYRIDRTENLRSYTAGNRGCFTFTTTDYLEAYWVEDMEIFSSRRNLSWRTF